MPRQTLKKRPDGRYVCKYKGMSFYGKTQSEALAAREEYKKAEKFGMKPREKYTFAEYAAEWLPTYKKDVTVNVYDAYASRLSKIASILPNVPMAEITPSDIKRLYNAFGGYMEATRAKMATLTKSVFRAAQADGLIAQNPCDNVKHTKGESGTHRALERWEIDLITSTYQSDPMGLMAMVMLYAGLRIGEAMAIDIDRDVDFAKGCIYVRGAIRDERGKPVLATTKTKNGIRCVPLFPPLLAALEGKHGRLTCRETLSKDMQLYYWGKYTERLSHIVNKKVSIRQHDLRHTFATMLYDADIDIKTASKWMGHANEQMILRVYAHLSQKKENDAIEKMKKMLSESSSGQNGSQDNGKKS